MKVISRQKNSRNCIICGMENESGVKAPFYNMKDGSAASLFSFFHSGITFLSDFTASALPPGRRFCLLLLRLRHRGGSGSCL